MNLFERTVLPVVQSRAQLDLDRNALVLLALPWHETSTLLAIQVIVLHLNLFNLIQCIIIVDDCLRFGCARFGSHVAIFAKQAFTYW